MIWLTVLLFFRLYLKKKTMLWPILPSVVQDWTLHTDLQHGNKANLRLSMTWS